MSSERAHEMSHSVERARVTSMILVIGIIVFITGITAFIAGRLQAKGSDLKQDINSASQSTVAVEGDGPEQKIIVNTEERDRLRVMKQMNDQLLLGVITGGIVTISILIVSMLIVNMGEGQRRRALERVDDLLPLPQMIPYGPLGPQPPPVFAGPDGVPVAAARSPARVGASPRRRIKKNASTSPRALSPRAALARSPRALPLSNAELAGRASDFDDFANAKEVSERLMGGAGGNASKSLGQLNNRVGGERNQLVSSEAGRLIETFYTQDPSRQDERAALRAEVGDVADLSAERAQEMVRARLGIQSNADMIRKRNDVFSRGALGERALR